MRYIFIVFLKIYFAENSKIPKRNNVFICLARTCFFLTFTSKIFVSSLWRQNIPNYFFQLVIFKRLFTCRIGVFFGLWIVWRIGRIYSLPEGLSSGDFGISLLNWKSASSLFLWIIYLFWTIFSQSISLLVFYVIGSRLVFCNLLIASVFSKWLFFILHNFEFIVFPKKSMLANFYFSVIVLSTFLLIY